MRAQRLAAGIEPLHASVAPITRRDLARRIIGQVPRLHVGPRLRQARIAIVPARIGRCTVVLAGLLIAAWIVRYTERVRIMWIGCGIARRWHCRSVPPVGVRRSLLSGREALELWSMHTAGLSSGSRLGVAMLRLSVTILRRPGMPLRGIACVRIVAGLRRLSVVAVIRAWRGLRIACRLLMRRLLLSGFRSITLLCLLLLPARIFTGSDLLLRLRGPSLRGLTASMCRRAIRPSHRHYPLTEFPIVRFGAIIASPSALRPQGLRAPTQSPVHKPEPWPIAPG